MSVDKESARALAEALHALADDIDKFPKEIDRAIKKSILWLVSIMFGPYFLFVLFEVIWTLTNR